MDNQKLKIWLGFGKFFLGTFALGLVTILVNSKIQNREITIKEQANRAEITIKEQSHLAKFTPEIIKDDVGPRRQLAQYFAAVTVSKELRDGWIRYNDIVAVEYQNFKEEKDVLTKNVQNLSGEEQNQAKKRISELESMLRTGFARNINPSYPYKKEIQAYVNSGALNLEGGLTLDLDSFKVKTIRFNEDNGDKVIYYWKLSEDDPVIFYYNQDFIPNSVWVYIYHTPFKNENNEIAIRLEINEKQVDTLYLLDNSKGSIAEIHPFIKDGSRGNITDFIRKGKNKIKISSSGNNPKVLMRTFIIKYFNRKPDY